MGAWGDNPFQSDAAAEFLEKLRTSPSRVIARTLGAVASVPTGEFIDIDDDAPGWAACELIALSFGYGDNEVDDSILDLATRIRPKEEHRALALNVLERIGDVTQSELASLWHEGADGERFDATLGSLRCRLHAAANGPREVPKPKVGDLIALTVGSSSDVVAVQVVAAGEVAVFEGTCGEARLALDFPKNRPARRVPTSVGKLLRRGQMLGNVPVPKNFKGRKLYAREGGVIGGYYLSTATGGGFRAVTYEEACQYDALRHHDADAICRVALGTEPIEQLRSPDEREAAYSAARAERWAILRKTTTPGPFGNATLLNLWLQWFEYVGVEKAIGRYSLRVSGASAYGRPSEQPERDDFTFAGVVAIWRGTWSADMWPAEFAGRFPPQPDDTLMSQALPIARVLASRILTRDAELRLIWDGSADGGTGLRTVVASLQKALAE